MAAGLEDRVFDVAVVGAGPAGAATARRLAACGRRVVVLERTRFDAPRVGESLAPNVQEALRDLGVWSEFVALAPLPSWGTCSVWGDETPQSHSHVMSPYGCGWHVDRLAFDRMLARAAAAAGCELAEGAAVAGSCYRDGLWHLAIEESAHGAPASRRTMRARMLVDATGRGAQVARRHGARRILLDRLVGVAVEWSGVDAGERGHLLLEAASEGWWYSAPLPDSSAAGGAMIAMLMTDADLCGRLRAVDAARFHRLLHSTRATSQRLGCAGPVSTPRVHCALSQRLRRDAAGDAPWLAVGDAALSVDPLSGSGVLRALRGARAAANAVHRCLDRPDDWPDALAGYEAERDRECTEYLMERARYYAAEERFDTPFWQRRHKPGRASVFH